MDKGVMLDKTDFTLYTCSLLKQHVILTFEVIAIITKELVDRINALARKQRAEGLTAEEKEEQHKLRQEYLKGIRSQVLDSLSRIKFVEDEKPNNTSGSCSCGHHHHKESHKGHTH
ncbi:DUF896 domain-containing protein [Desulfotomaculum nigrificans]|uniref:DUF896 domain-containing protein n=1 Tax=Desulfotomaculum nigrificans TaxID=1565 RepID=UPI0002FCF005|nr:DUF896 domain-containing protein [Desulfotomaculum nigrificans]